MHFSGVIRSPRSFYFVLNLFVNQNLNLGLNWYLCDQVIRNLTTLIYSSLQIIFLRQNMLFLMHDLIFGIEFKSLFGKDLISHRLGSKD